jgi:hypothetical protein
VTLSKQHALAIKDKLKAEPAPLKKGRPHDLFLVREGGQVVARFGIRRGSNKHLPHDHLPKSLHVTPRQARDLADCPMSREEWIARLREAGELADP